MKKLKMASFVIFCISLAASLLFLVYTSQKRGQDRTGDHN